jgi:hypothetical protein
MFGCQRFQLSRLRQPRRLLIALTLTVATTSTAAASPAGPVDHLQRDLGALQAQLEQIDPELGDNGPQTVGFNADLGDGSPAFRRQSLVAMVHASARNLDRLIVAYRAAGDEQRAGGAETLRLSMYGLTERFERLAQPADSATLVVLRDQTGALLAELVQDLSLLAAEPAPADPTAAPAPQPLP